MITRNQNRFSEKKSNCTWSFIFADKVTGKEAVWLCFLAFAALVDWAGGGWTKPMRAFLGVALTEYHRLRGSLSGRNVSSHS